MSVFRPIPKIIFLHIKVVNLNKSNAKVPFNMLRTYYHFTS